MCRTVCWKLALQGLFGVAVFIFWWRLYPSALAWQEQFQLFLFDGPYLAERLAVPGGVAAYVAEFLVQFYNHPFMGAAVLVLLYLAIQMLVWRLMKQCVGGHARGGLFFVLSFLPSLGVWLAMGDVNMMLALPVSLVMTLAVALAVPAHGRARIVVCLLGVPLVYWLVGPMVFVWVLLLCMRGVSLRSSATVMTVVWLLYALLCVWLSTLFEPYPLRRLLAGIFYYRLPDMFSYWLLLPAALCLLVVGMAASLQKLSAESGRRWHTVVGTVMVVVAMLLLLPKAFDGRTYELVEYDYLVRTQRWPDIVRKAEKRPPDLPMSVCAVNLALGMTNRLCDRAFEFYQNGVEGLAPLFMRDFNSTQLTGEVYFHLGLVNTAQRYAFEAMEAIPNYYKSGRAVKRLSETNLINGQYKVAEKYLLMLKKTVFYRKWAQRRLDMLADTARIDRHPVYGRMRQLRLRDDFLFSEAELDRICGQLLSLNPANGLAKQYLLLYPLLNRNPDSFMDYYRYVNSLGYYNPVVCQEAVAFVCMMNKTEAPAGLVSNEVMKRFKRFAQSYTLHGKDSPQMEAYRNTLWYYLTKGQ